MPSRFDSGRDSSLPSSAELEALLAAAQHGDRAAFDRAFALVYDELKRMASIRLDQFASEPLLSTTAVVHETYLKLAGEVLWSGHDRRHFFALAARAMRQILLDQARSRARGKRGGAAPHLSLEDVEVPVAVAPEELLALDQALARLGELDAELAQLVEWRFFAGLGLEEIASLTGVSERTVKRHWRTARATLHRLLAAPDPSSPPP